MKLACQQRAISRVSIILPACLMEAGWRDNQLTVGVNHDFTSIISFQFNFDTYFPNEGDNKHGVSLILQMYF